MTKLLIREFIRPLTPLSGGVISSFGFTSDVSYLTDNSNNILTDNSGNRLFI